MARTIGKEPWGLGKYILQFRFPIGLALIAITAFMAYWAARVQIATKFENFFPSQHENTLLYRKYSYRYGGAQTLLMMLRVKQDDIYNYSTLGKIRDIQAEMNTLPGSIITRSSRWRRIASVMRRCCPVRS